MRGILWMLAAGMLFAALNAQQKYLTHGMHPPEVVCLRYFTGSLILLPFAIRAGWEAYRPRRIGFMGIRSVVHAAGSLLWFFALPFVGLAETSAIGFTGPIFMMVGAALFLGERMYAARWIAVVVAFAGVLIVVAPGLFTTSTSPAWALLMLVVCSPVTSISFLMSKVLTRSERPDAIVFWLGIFMAVLTLPFALVDWRWPTPLEWALLTSCGVIGSAAHYCMTRAYRIADVGAVQSVRFVDLVYASLAGFLVFSHIPTVWTLAGGAVICGATVWIARFESRRPRALTGTIMTKRPAGPDIASSR